MGRCITMGRCIAMAVIVMSQVRGRELNIFPDREGRDGMVVQNSHSRTTDLPDSHRG